MALFGMIGSKQPDGKRRLSPRTRSVFAYSHLPGILPRIRALGDKFGHFAYLLALIYRSARLLPAGHPMLNPANIGRFGIRDVMATAANGLVMKRENLDQIFIFGAVAAALIMIVVQAVLIGLYAFMGTADASSAPGTNFFTTTNPNTDLAFKFMQQVFGVNIFGSGTVNTQAGLHAILGFYSTAMMIVAVIIVVYYVITLVGESAQTGTPFGKRFNGLWAPIRLVLALGLLVPIAGGLNSAQYLTLYVAKFGSSLATNAWIKYTKTFSTNETKAKMDAPSMVNLGHVIFSAEACTALYNARYPEKPVRSIIEWTDSSGVRSAPAQVNASDLNGKSGSVRFVWTKEAPGGKINEATCGSISMAVLQELTTGSEYDKSVRTLEITYQTAYANAMGAMKTGFGPAAAKFKDKFLETRGLSATERDKITLQSIADLAAPLINTAQTTINGLNNTSSSANTASYASAVKENMIADAENRGWASAGSYYVEIARANQSINDAKSRTFPVATEKPAGEQSTVMQNASYWSPSAWWRWAWQDNAEAATEAEVAKGMANLPEIIRLTTAKINVMPAGVPSNAKFDAEYGLSRPLLVLGRFLFGDALIKVMDEPTVNPMEGFIQAGSYILDRSEHMVYALVMGQAGKFVGGTIGTGVAALVGGISFGNGFVSGVAWAAIVALAAYMPTIVIFFILFGLFAGIMLFYILPLLPFMMFFFSVVNWVIEVAEAFIAAPLFALSHLRIDGEGLPGQNAYAGWLTLFGVMIRPILIIIGLIIASLIFGAASSYLVFIFKQAVFSYRNTTNGVIDLSQIGQIGILFYMLLFIYMLYILANSCFKLIDMIPDKAMRWIGGQQPFTGDRPVDIGSMQTLAVAGYGAMTQGKDAMGGAVKDVQQNWEKFKGRDKGGPGGSVGG